MERRKAITVAAAASLTLLAGAAGIALNSGIVGAGSEGNIGQISPVDPAANPPITVYVNDPTGTGPSSGAVTVQPTNASPVTSPGARVHADDGDNGDESDDDAQRTGADRNENEQERGEQHEGADDDD